jgi:pyruvate,water dikinase
MQQAEALSASAVWTRANIGEVLPGAVTPLTWSVFRQGLLNLPLSVVDGPAGHGLVDAADEGVRLIKGRAYLRLDKMLQRFCWLPGVTPEIMRWVLGVDVPEFVRPYPDAGMTLSPSAWVEQGAFLADALLGVPLLRRRVRSDPLVGLEQGGSWSLPADLGAGFLEQALTSVARCFQLHIRCTSYAVGVFGLVVALLRRWLPTEAERLLPALLRGQPGLDLQTAAQGVSLWKLAEQARQNPALEALLLREVEWQTLEPELERVAGGSEWVDEFEGFLRRNGARTAGEFELRTPRWRENSAFVLVALRSYLRDRQWDVTGCLLDQRQRTWQEALSRAEMQLRPGQRILFWRLLESYRTCASLRENMKYRLMEGYYLLRRLFLALGERFCAQGLIEAVDDVFFLTASETIALARGERVSGLGIRPSIHERREAHVLWEQQAAPSWVNDVPCVPAPPVQAPASGTTLKGIACSPGQGQGRARVLRDLALAATFQSGEVLVAPSTDPGWTPLFLTAAGLVTEIGGFLSHGATVAREYGVPAVVNVNYACTVIRTGDMVTVDGDRGRVLIYREAAGR